MSVPGKIALSRRGKQTPRNLVMYLHDDDWDEGPSHVPTPEEEAAAKERYEARKAACLAFAAENPLVKLVNGLFP